MNQVGSPLLTHTTRRDAVENLELSWRHRESGMGTGFCRQRHKIFPYSIPAILGEKRTFCLAEKKLNRVWKEAWVGIPA